METERTTQTASTSAGSLSRRAVLRALAGFALTGTGTAIFHGAVGAKKKRKGKDKDKDKGTKGGNGRCGRKRRLARLQVPHDGTIVHTPVLESGRRYRLRVSGYVSGSTLLTPIGIDAGFLFRRDGQLGPTFDTYGDADMGLSVDGAAAHWGDYEADHVYQREVVGQGERLALRLVSRPDEPSFNQGTARRLITVFDYDFDLSGTLTVEVLCS
jgi:hypothetical protein